MNCYNVNDVNSNSSNLLFIIITTAEGRGEKKEES
jgi:hypothetical protein